MGAANRAPLPLSLSFPVPEGQNELDGAGNRTKRSLALRPVQVRDEGRCVRFPESNELWRRQDETGCQLRVAEVADMNHMGHTRTHDRVTLIGDVSLPSIVGYAADSYASASLSS